MIRLQDASVRYGEVVALRGVSLHVQPGDRLALVLPLNRLGVVPGPIINDARVKIGRSLQNFRLGQFHLVP